MTAVFDLPPAHPARSILEEAGIAAGDELILRRVSSADGRRTAYVNDRRVSAEVLRDLGELLVELHGQHDDRGLLNSRGHRQLLDQFGGHDLGGLRVAWGAMAEARKGLTAAEAEQAALKAEEEYLRHAVGELDKLDPRPGEEAELDAKRRMMQAGQRIREDIARAAQAMGQEGAEGLLGNAVRWLDGAAGRSEGQLDEPMAALSRAMTELGEALQGVENCLDALAFDPQEMERVEERLFATRALARKHGVLADDLGTFAEDLRGRLAALDGAAGSLKALKAAVQAAEDTYTAEATALSTARAAAAAALDKAIAGELAPLKMERAHFATRDHKGGAGSRGARSGGVHRGYQPRRTGRPVEQDRVGGGTVALPACAESLSGAGRRGADHDLRRDRPGCGWRDGGCRGPSACAAGRDGADPGRDPQPAGGRARGASLEGWKSG